jgi:hypothetical protein
MKCCIGIPIRDLLLDSMLATLLFFSVALLRFHAVRGCWLSIRIEGNFTDADVLLVRVECY